MLVSEEGNHRVTRWAPGATEGEVVAGGNGAGAELDQLDCPRGIALDEDGHLLIADSGNNRVVRWDLQSSQGELVAGGCGEGKSLRHVCQPNYVVVEPTGAMLIAEGGLGARVSRWWPPELRFMRPAEKAEGFATCAAHGQRFVRPVSAGELQFDGTAPVGQGELVVGDGKLECPWGLALVPARSEPEPIASEKSAMASESVFTSERRGGLASKNSEGARPRNLFVRFNAGGA